MKVAQTSSNKKLYNWVSEYQPGGNVAVPVSTKLILTTVLFASYSNIPAFLIASVGMPRYIMETGWGPIIPGVAFQSHLCWQQRRTRVELFYSQGDNLDIHLLCQPLFQFSSFGNFIVNQHLNYMPHLDHNIFKWYGGNLSLNHTDWY